MTQKMSFAEAMLKGCEGTTKAIGIRDNYMGGYCALGAAERGAGLYCMGAENYWPFLRKKVVNPVTGTESDENMAWTVAKLNNNHGWSREEIAKWAACTELKYGFHKTETEEIPA